MAESLVWVGIFLGLLVGFALGLLGGGGSILAVPIFVYLLGIDRELAIPASLAVVGLTSFIGSWPHYRASNLDLRGAGFFLAGSLGGSLLGALIGQKVDDTIQMIAFACIMLAASIMMFRGRRTQGEEKDAAQPILLMGLGVIVGSIVGLVGIGGGFMYVPALAAFAAMPMKRAIGTSLLVIALNAMFGLSGYLIDAELRHRIITAQVGPLTLPLALAIFTSLTVIGIIAGAAQARRSKPEILRRIFATFLFLIGTGVLINEVIRFISHSHDPSASANQRRIEQIDQRDDHIPASLNQNCSRKRISFS